MITNVLAVGAWVWLIGLVGRERLRTSEWWYWYRHARSFGRSVWWSARYARDRIRFEQ